MASERLSLNAEQADRAASAHLGKEFACVERSKALLGVCHLESRSES
jgi:hypothetical protein